MRCFLCFTIFTPIAVILLIDFDNSNMPLDMYMRLFEKEYKMHWSFSGVNPRNSGEYFLSYGFDVEHYPVDEIEAFKTWYKVLTEALMFISNVTPTITLIDPKLDACKQRLYLTFHYPDFTPALHPDLGQISCSNNRLVLTYFKIDEERLKVYEEEQEFLYEDFIKSIGFYNNTPFELSDLEGHVADVRP